jgi:beta-galactosidase
MRLWAWQSIIHGADLLSFFRWRTCPYGSEQHWHGLIDADDRDSRRLAEARQLGDELRKIPDEFFRAPMTRSVAILRDFDNEVNDSRINTYIKNGAGEHLRWYAALVRRHIPADMVWAGGDLRGYEVLISPHLKIVDRAKYKWIEAFVHAGGTLVLGAQSGLKDKNCHIVEQPAPGIFRKLTGIEVTDWTTLGPNESRTARFAGGPEIKCTTFVERLRLRGAVPMANWHGHERLLGDAPAVTTHRAGKGRVIYVGGYCDEAAAASVIAELGLPSVVNAPPQVEVVQKRIGRQILLALLNHSPISQRIDGVASPATDLLTGKSLRGSTVILPGYGVSILGTTRRA